jgi:hypothetical protein
MTGVGFSPSSKPVSAVSPSYGKMRSDTLLACVAAPPSRAVTLATSVSAAQFPSSLKIARFR